MLSDRNDARKTGGRLTVLGAGNHREIRGHESPRPQHSPRVPPPFGVCQVLGNRIPGEGVPHNDVEARFAEWEDLCRTPAFRGRACRLVSGEDGLALDLDLSLPSPRESAPESLDPQALLALRYHFPSTIHYHNSPGGIERGNILAWKRTLREHFAGRPLDVEVRFDRRTVLAAAVSILGLSLGLVLASLGTALVLMVRKGRRQLRAEAIAAYPSRSDHPGGG